MNTKTKLAEIHNPVPIATNGLWVADPDTDFTDFSGSSPPKKLMFSLNGKCNLRCDHCSRATFDIRSQQTDSALVDYVIEHVLPHVRSVRLGGTDLGEQLTSPHFDRLLTAIGDIGGIHLEITSNLTLMNPARADVIARTCSRFDISMEGVAAQYESVRHFRWETVEQNLAMLVEARSKHPESKLQIVSLVTCFRDNLDHLHEILDLANQGVDSFHFRLFAANTPEQEGQVLSHHAKASNEVFRRLRQIATERHLNVTIPSPLPESETIEFQFIPLKETSLAHKRTLEREQASSAEVRAHEDRVQNDEGSSASQDGRVPESTTIDLQDSESDGSAAVASAQVGLHQWGLKQGYWTLRVPLVSRIFPVDSRRRLVAKMFLFSARNPRAVMMNLNRRNIAGFLAFMTGDSPSLIEEKMAWKIEHAKLEAANAQSVFSMESESVPEGPVDTAVSEATVDANAPEQKSFTDFGTTKPAHPPWICPFPFETVSILSDGRVGTCCSPIVFGKLDIEAPNLDALWQGEDWTGLRSDLANDRYSGHCQTCSYRLETVSRLATTI